VGGEDHYVWLVLSECGKFEYVPEPLAIYRHIPPMETVEKYEGGRKTFVRLVGQRYSARASAHIREGRDFFSGTLLAGAIDEFDRGNMARAVQLLRRAVHNRQFLFFYPKPVTKLFSTRNAKRLAIGLFSSILRWT
jgi:hypothetical protein